MTVSYGTPTQGAQVRLAVQDSETSTISDFGSGSFAYEFNRETLHVEQTFDYNHGIRGTRSRSSDRVRLTKEVVMGAMDLNPTWVELLAWLLRAGMADSTGTVSLLEAVPVFSVLKDMLTQRHIFTGCFVDKIVIRGSQGEPITMTIDMEGKSETLSATVWPVGIPAIDSGTMYIMADATFALGADTSAGEVRDFTLTIDNVLDKGRFMNQTTRRDIVAQDRAITLDMTVPYTSVEKTLYHAGVTGNTGTLVLTDAAKAFTFSFANLKCPASGPVTDGKSEVWLPLHMTAYATDSTKELIVTYA